MRLAPTSGPLQGQLIDFGPSQDFPTTNTGTGHVGVQPGTIFTCASTDGGIDTTTSVPNWGAAEVMYVVNTSSSTFVPGNLVQIDKNYAISAAATTDNTGAPIYVCLSTFSAGDVTRQGGWILLSATSAPVTFSVAATTGQIFLGTSKNATPTANTGGQILNATTIIAAAGNFTRTIQTQSGSSQVKVARVNGLYPGLAITGTGIPASSVISSIDPSGVAFTIGSAIGTPVNATATGSVTGTFTHTGYGIVAFNRPFVQGQIT